MSGHSKWSTIKHQKQVTDQKRGQTFSKLAKAITLAVRNGGGITDPDSNFRLRLAIERAKSANMPKANIQRAIVSGAGKNTAEDQIHEVVYEGFAPHGVAILVEVATDNKNRAQSTLRSTFGKAGGTMAGGGAVSHLFEHVGIVFVSKKLSYDKVLEYVLDTQARDVEESDDHFMVYTHGPELHLVKQRLEDKGLEITGSSLGYRPLTTIAIDQSKGRVVTALLEKLSELDDVQEVYTNADFT